MEAWWACVQEVDGKLGPGPARHHPPILSDSVSVEYEGGTFLVSSSVTLGTGSGAASFSLSAAYFVCCPIPSRLFRIRVASLAR